MLTEVQLMIKSENENFPSKSRRRAVRRECSAKADIRRRRVVDLPGYHPKRGYYHFYISCDPVTGRRIAVDDKRYIHYPKSCEGSQYLKNMSDKRIRRLGIEDICGKGNRYRKFYDYKWAMD